jgi:hypothetical protein
MLLMREVDLKSAYLSGYPRLRHLSAKNLNRFFDHGSRACRRQLEACYVPKPISDDK